MSFLDSIFTGVNAAKGNKKADWVYNQLEITPYLHDSSELRHLYSQANKEQKASIMVHIERFDVDDRMDRPHMKEYKDLANDIWDDFL
ncbi:hypothetical protein [Radiobacillus sp. PE A8.2]|uniref:hypothetical protein n=1 Tax=Radiobacillus sp. PE A8.2 TaxID=3380349 RepID=UPI00388EA342